MDESVFVDEIVDIEYVGEKETLDIQVSGNNLFYANGILTHNSGASNSDPGMENVAESAGISHTADMMFALISTEELEALNQMMIKQVKNRYNDITRIKRFIIGVDRSKMKLYDVESSAQVDISDSGNTAEEIYAKSSVQSIKNKFESFKI